MRLLKVDKSLKYAGEQISYRVEGSLKQIQQLVKEFQPKKVVFAETSRYKSLDEYLEHNVDVYIQVYLLFEEEQAMLFRLSKKI
jgi:1-deoxy-D-xylulose 5-phosphate reductoisomerase